RCVEAAGYAARARKTGPAGAAVRTLPEVAFEGRASAWHIRQAAIAADHACYRYTATLGARNKKREETGLKSLAIAGNDDTALARGKAIAAGVAFARELGNLPPN